MIEPTAFSWRASIITVYGPAVLFSLGEGAVLPMIPHVAEQRGASLAVAGFIAALITVGEFLGTLPTGWLLPRIGERAAMFIAAGVTVAGAALALFAPGPILLGLGILLIGIAAVVFQLARQAFLTVHVPLEYRARSLSTLGGMYRLGITIGPFLIAAVIGLGADPVSAFLIQAVCAVLVVLLLLFVRDPGHGRDAARAARRPEDGMLATFRRNGRVLATVGTAAATLMAMRQVRQMILPLWAVAIALDPDATALVIGIASLVDFALFYTGGLVMDRFGRMWVVMPVTIGLAVGHIVLGLSAGLPAPLVWFSVVAGILALANGIGSGVVMTLSADLADPRNPAPFLAVWRLFTNTGGALAPLLVSAVTAISTLGIAAIVVGGIGVAGAWLFAVFLPRHDPRRRQDRVDPALIPTDDA